MALSPTAQAAAPGELVPQPFSVRVERSSGEPVPGALVSFEVDLCFSGVPLPGPGCPTGSEYGGFVTGAASRPLGVVVTADASGVATAPAYRVGIPRPERGSFSFEVFPYVPAQTTPGGLTISLFDALHPLDGLGEDATTITVLGSAGAEVPTLGGAAAAALACLLAGLALSRLR